MAEPIIRPQIMRGHLFFIVQGTAFAKFKSALCAAGIVLEGSAL
jgi:hypothetical protein